MPTIATSPASRCHSRQWLPGWTGAQQFSSLMCNSMRRSTLLGSPGQPRQRAQTTDFDILRTEQTRSRCSMNTSSMNTKCRVIWTVLALGILAAPVTLFAHHGNAIYDESKAVTVKGVVTEWVWANPHCLLEFDVKDDKGQSVHWTAEVRN